MDFFASRPLLSLSILCLLSTACGGGGGGGGGASGGTTSSTPVITQLQPASGRQGHLIKIAGSGFNGNPLENTVRFNTTVASVIDAINNELTVEVPAGLSGQIDVTVENTAGQQSAASSFQVELVSLNAPSITSVAPEVTTPRATIQINGQNFNPTAQSNTVLIDGLQATVQSATANTLTVTVPSNAQSTRVLVSTAQGSSNAMPLFITTTQASAQGFSGQQANAFVAPTQFTHLIVEIDVVANRTPIKNALNRLETRLNERLNKPGGIKFIVDDQVADPNNASWSVGEIMNIEGQNRDFYASGNTAVMYFIYIPNGSDFDNGNSRVLGISYTGSSLAIFKDTIDSTSTLALTAETIERAVLVHEAGHAIGLVNNGLPMVNNHQDAQNGAHDVSQNCVMHFSIESNSIAQLTGTVPDQFDQQCIDDVRAGGGK